MLLDVTLVIEESLKAPRPIPTTFAPLIFSGITRSVLLPSYLNFFNVKISDAFPDHQTLNLHLHSNENRIFMIAHFMIT